MCACSSYNPFLFYLCLPKPPPLLPRLLPLLLAPKLPLLRLLLLDEPNEREGADELGALLEREGIEERGMTCVAEEAEREAPNDERSTTLPVGISVVDGRLMGRLLPMVPRLRSTLLFPKEPRLRSTLLLPMVPRLRSTLLGLLAPNDVRPLLFTVVRVELLLRPVRKSPRSQAERMPM